MSFDQAFPETQADARRALAAAMSRFLPHQQQQAEQERAPDAWAWRCMREIADALNREPGADDGRENHQREAAEVIAATARVFLAAATKAGDEHGVRCWTQMLTYATRVTP